MRLAFLKPVVILTIILIVLLAYPIYALFPDTRAEIFAAWGIGLLNVVLGLLTIELTLEKENYVFMAAFFGGMGIRVFLILFSFAVLLSMEFDKVVLTFFLMGFYFVYLIIEMRYLIRVLSKQKGQKAPKYVYQRTR